MKTQTKFSTLAKTAASVLLLGCFIWLLAASLDFFALPETVRLTDGRYQETVAVSAPLPYETVSTGNQTTLGTWTGEVEIVEKSSQISYHTTTSTGLYVDGEKDGVWKMVTLYPGFPDIVGYIRYDHGKETNHWKGLNSGTPGPSAFDILTGENYSFLNSMGVFGLDSSKIRLYTDSLEAGLSRMEFNQSGFETAYNSVRSDLDLYPAFDSISGVVTFLTHYRGLYRINSNEFRLAVLDRNRAGTGTTYDVVLSGYPGYKTLMNDNLVSDNELEVFCHQVDSTMDTYGQLNREDDFFVDSVDIRLYRAISAIGSATFTSVPSIVSRAESGRISLKNGRNEAVALLHAMQGLKSSGNKAEAVFLNDVFALYNETDAVMVSVRKACFANRQWVQLPEMTTGYSGSNSMTSVTITGSVIGSGGADITARGIVWADTYNPSVREHTVVSGTGLGMYTVVIEGLLSGKVYYARSFATNSAGTAYGNCIEFTTERSASTGAAILNPFRANIYPNPARLQATLFVSASQPVTCHITLSTIDGRIVLQRDMTHPGQGAMPLTLDLSGLPSGVYWCRITNGIGNLGIRLLKMD